jgi:tRNA (guanine-N7-)-methyltransferase
VVEAIRSYNARRGRLSQNQRLALETWGPRLDLQQRPDPLDLDVEFGRTASRTLEIGSGIGDTSVRLAHEQPANDFIAADVHTKGIARTLMLIDRHRLSNLRVMHGDAMELCQRLPAGSLNAVLVFFPDPWPKAKHNKRRLVRLDFARAVTRVLRPGGCIHLATDDRAYAEVMREVLDHTSGLIKVHDGRRVPDRPRTKYEQAGENAGRHAIDLVYRFEAPSQI